MKKMRLLQEFRAWLRLGRMHTLILEAPLATLGAAIGLGGLWDWKVLLWFIFGSMYHAVGYSMNSYVDWKKGYDKNDERKQHHPLNTQDISPDTAKKVIYASTF